MNTLARFIEIKLANDYNKLLSEIENHTSKNDIISMFKKGPPANKGFMWSLNDTTYWTESELKALKLVSTMILNLQWESSGLALMLRKLQKNFI